MEGRETIEKRANLIKGSLPKERKKSIDKSLGIIDF